MTIVLPNVGWMPNLLAVGVSQLLPCDLTAAQATLSKRSWNRAAYVAPYIFYDLQEIRMIHCITVLQNSHVSSTDFNTCHLAAHSDHAGPSRHRGPPKPCTQITLFEQVLLNSNGGSKKSQTATLENLEMKEDITMVVSPENGRFRAWWKWNEIYAFDWYYEHNSLTDHLSGISVGRKIALRRGSQLAHTA